MLATEAQAMSSKSGDLKSSMKERKAGNSSGRNK